MATSLAWREAYLGKLRIVRYLNFTEELGGVLGPSICMGNSLRTYELPRYSYKWRFGRPVGGS